MRKRQLISVSCALLVALVVSPLSADLVVLKNGKQLRGVDFQKKGSEGFFFTLEDGNRIFIPDEEITSHQESPRGEKIDFRGQQITLRKKISLMRKEEAARKKKMMGTIERWARKGKGSEEAEGEILSLPGQNRERYLAHTLLNSSYMPARTLSARKLAAFKDSHSARSLVAGAMNDRSIEVRSYAMMSLVQLAHPGTSDYIIPYLGSKKMDHRVRASYALTSFPGDDAVPAIIATASQRWSGFGRAYFAQLTQRAYISDYELVSGGTGFTVIEVADPVVRTMQTGVVLDIDVTQVEVKSHVHALSKITGRNFGTDFKKWSAWWEAEGRTARSPAARSPATESGKTR